MSIWRFRYRRRVPFASAPVPVHGRTYGTFVSVPVYVGSVLEYASAERMETQYKILLSSDGKHAADKPQKKRHDKYSVMVH